MVVHQAVGKDAHVRALAPLLEQLDERREIAGLVEDLHPAVAAVEDVVDRVVRGPPGTSWHEAKVASCWSRAIEGAVSPLLATQCPFSLRVRSTVAIPTSGALPISWFDSPIHAFSKTLART